MPFAHPIVIVNPQSQGGALGRKWSEVAETLRRSFGSFESQFTQGPMEATMLARKAIEDGADLIVAVGGDGTLHEVVNGFFDDHGNATPTHACLGFIPFGTGGDFRRTAGVSKRIDEAASNLKFGTQRRIDVGLLTFHPDYRRPETLTRVFVNIASFGIGGLVDRIVNSSSKALGGRASFLLGTARALLLYRNKRVRLVFDDKEDDFLETRVNNVAVANGQYFGGGMRIAPGASLDDEKFDVTVLGDLSKAEVLRLSTDIYQGTHLKRPKVFHRLAQTLTARPVDPDDEVLLDVDGEALGSLPARFWIRPKAIQMILPKASA